MSYFLDTSTCIALINAASPGAREKFGQERRNGRSICTSTIVAFELWFGVEKSRRKQANTDRLNDFLAIIDAVHGFDHEDARVAGTIRAGLEANGMPIGSYDLMIGTQALRRGMTLVTANVREFKRIADLRVENWVTA